MNVVGYVNSYRSKDIDKSLEIKFQREKISDFCKNHGFELLKIYEEPDNSRPDFKPALMRLIGDAKQNTFKKLIVLNLSKLGPEEEIKQWVLDELAGNKIEVFSLTESVLLKSSEANADADENKKAKSIREKVKDIPSLPEVVTRVMELVQDPNSSAAQLSKIISHDPGLTSRVLRLVNSAYYGFPKQISSIQHAIMILGFTTMRGLVLSSSIFKIFAPKTIGLVNFDYKKLWKHSLLTAMAARSLHKTLYYNDNEDIFSAAILHDIGKIILDQYDHENYAKVIQQSQNGICSEEILENELEFCQISHREIGFMVAESWNLPKSLIDVIKYHHTPLESEEYPILTSLVYVANILSKIVIDELNFDIQMFDPEVLDFLGLSESNLIDTNLQLIEELQKVGDFESFFK